MMTSAIYRIRVVAARNAVTLIIICCFATLQIQSFQSQRVMKVMQKRHKYNNIFAAYRSSSIPARPLGKKRDNKHNKVQSLKMSSSTYRLQSVTTDENEVNEKSFRQKDQPTTGISISPTLAPVNNNNNNSKDGEKQPPAPVTASTTFTISPVAAPGNDKDKGKTTNTPVRTPTIRPVVSITDVPSTDIPTREPILSIPLDVKPTSPSPTTFFADPSMSPTTTPIATTTTQPPSMAPLITTTNSPTIVPIITIINITNGTTDQSKSVADNTTNTTSNGKVKSGTIVGIFLGILISMILSVMVLKARHKYVQKHGAASTRRRKLNNKALQEEEEGREITGAVIDSVDDELHNIKTVHIITGLNHDTTDTSSPADRTYEIHLEEDDAHIYSQESSFISTSGGEEMESDIDIKKDSAV